VRHILKKEIKREKEKCVNVFATEGAGRRSLMTLGNKLSRSIKLDWIGEKTDPEWKRTATSRGGEGAGEVGLMDGFI